MPPMAFFYKDFRLVVYKIFLLAVNETQSLVFFLSLRVIA